MTQPDHAATAESAATHRKAAGIFDVRNIIAALLGIYGVVLTILGAVDFTDADSRKTDGVNLNLWAGLALVVVAVLMAVWAVLRPILVPVEETVTTKPKGQ